MANVVTTFFEGYLVIVLEFELMGDEKTSMYILKGIEKGIEMTLPSLMQDFGAKKALIRMIEAVIQQKSQK